MSSDVAFGDMLLRFSQKRNRIMNITGSFSKLLLLLEILTVLQNLDCKNATLQGDIHI